MCKRRKKVIFQLLPRSSDFAWFLLEVALKATCTKQPAAKCIALSVFSQWRHGSDVMANVFKAKKPRFPIYGICLQSSRGVFCEMLGGGVPAGHWNPYLISGTFPYTLYGSATPVLWSILHWSRSTEKRICYRNLLISLLSCVYVLNLRVVYWNWDCRKLRRVNLPIFRSEQLIRSAHVALSTCNKWLVNFLWYICF